MTKKMGRPPAEKPRINQTRIRMTDEEVKKLEFCCRKTGLNKTEVILQGIEKVYNEVKDK